MQYRLLGPLEVRQNGLELSLSAGKQRALLAVLLLRRNEVVPVEQLIDDLWRGEAPANAAKSVQVYVSQLRKALGDGVIVTRPPGYMLNVADEETDVGRFEQLVARSADAPPREASDLLREALRLWRGPPLADFRYEDFAQAEIARLEELRLSALEERIDADLGLRRHARLVPELEALVHEHPLRERLRAQLMLALYGTGRQAEALGAYQAARRALLDGLGIEPGPELQDLERRILEQDPELPRARPRSFIPPAIARRGWAIVAAGAVLVAGAAAAAAWELTHRTQIGVPGGVVARVDPSGERAALEVALPTQSTQLSAWRDGVWALNDDAKTLVAIDARTRSASAPLAAGPRPADVLTAAGAVWILNSGALPPPGVKRQPERTTLLRLDPQTRSVTATTELPPPPFPYPEWRPQGERWLAYGAGSIWVIASDRHVYRVDRRTAHVVAEVRGLYADTLAFGNGRLWVSESAGRLRLARVDPRTNRVDARIPVPAASHAAIAVGAGSVWVADPFEGAVWRVDPGPPVYFQSIAVAPGVTSLAFAHGSVWALSDVEDTLARIDPAKNAVTATLAVASPRALDATRAGVWVSSGTPARESLPSTSCGPVVFGAHGRPDFLIASDFPLQDPSADARTLVRAVTWALRRRGFRAGRYSVGLQSCDDSTARIGGFDFAKCAANAHAYAETPRVLGVVGTYNSPCTGVQLPILNRGRGGAVPIVSPSNTFDVLTRTTPGQPPRALAVEYPSGVRNFARVVAADHIQYAADAVLAVQLHLRRVAIFADDVTSTQAPVTWFREAASKLGIRAQVVRWRLSAPDLEPVAARIRALGVDGVFIAAGGLPEGGKLVRALRAKLGRGFRILVTDYFTAPADFAHFAGAAADGTYVSVAGVPANRLPPAGAAFRRAFGAKVSIYAPLAAQATDVLLDAIAASDGTRTSVLKRLFALRIRPGIVGDIRFDQNGDLVTGPVTILRMQRGAPNELGTTGGAGAVVARIITPPPSIVP